MPLEREVEEVHGFVSPEFSEKLAVYVGLAEKTSG